MALSEDIATLRKETHRKGERGILGEDRGKAYLAIQIDGLWNAIELIARAHDEDGQKAE